MLKVMPHPPTYPHPLGTYPTPTPTTPIPENGNRLRSIKQMARYEAMIYRCDNPKCTKQVTVPAGEYPADGFMGTVTPANTPGTFVQWFAHSDRCIPGAVRGALANAPDAPSHDTHETHDTHAPETARLPFDGFYPDEPTTPAPTPSQAPHTPQDAPSGPDTATTAQSTTTGPTSPTSPPDAPQDGSDGPDDQDAAIIEFRRRVHGTGTAEDTDTAPPPDNTPDTQHLTFDGVRTLCGENMATWTGPAPQDAPWCDECSRLSELAEHPEHPEQEPTD